MERRELFAGDVFASNHNYQHPYDVNNDGTYSSLDVLAVINHLRVSDLVAAESIADAESGMYLDVNADERVSSADALEVMNAIGRGEAFHQVELLLNARSLDDELIIRDRDGNINVAVGQPFYLEVSYNDLRMDDPRLGLFQILADISVSEGHALEPVLTETQRLGIDSLIKRQPADSEGTLTFAIEGSNTTYVSQFADFAQSPREEVVRAMETLGYDSSQYEFSTLEIGNDDVGFQIIFVDPEFRDIDMPNLSITADGFSEEIFTYAFEIAPRNPDGSINSDAVRFNVDAFSRTFNNNERFYQSLHRGNFNPVEGFNEVGGLGRVPVNGGGIPNITNDGGFLNPFDAFSLLVQFTRPVSGFEAEVNPGEDEEATLLYGREDALNQDFVLTDGDAIVTFNAFEPADLPATVSDDTSIVVDEDGSTSIDLSSLLSGASPVWFGAEASSEHGVTRIDDTVLTYRPGENVNGPDQIVYSVIGSNGIQRGKIAVTITPKNDAPVLDSDQFSAASGETLVIELSQLLDGDVDVDGDDLTVTGVGDPDVDGATTSLDDSVTYIAPPGFSGVDSFTYTVSDGTTSVEARVEVFVGDVAPTAADGSLAVLQGESADLDLSTLVTGRPFDTVISVDDPSRGFVSLDGSVVLYTTDSDAESSPYTATFTYTVTNGAGSDTGTITVTVNTKLPPVVTDPIVVVREEDDPEFEIDLLANAFDPDRVGNGVDSQLKVVDLTITGNADRLLHLETILVVNPEHYDALLDGQSVSSVVNYFVEDQQGLRTPHQVTVIVHGRSDPARARNDFVRTEVNQPVHVRVLKNDEIAQGEVGGTLEISSVVSDDQNATVVLSADRRSVYVIPNEGFIGTTSFFYRLNDSSTISARGVLTVGDSDGTGVGDADEDVTGSTIEFTGPLLLDMPLVGGGGIRDGDVLIIKDQLGNDVVFEFNVDHQNQLSLADSIPIVYDFFDTVETLMHKVVTAINNADLGIDAQRVPETWAVSLGNIDSARVNTNGVRQISQHRQNSVNDGDILTIRQGNISVSYEFDALVEGGGVGEDNVAVTFSPLDEIGAFAETVADALNNNSAGLRLNAIAEIDAITGEPTGKILLNDLPGTVVDGTLAPGLSIVQGEAAPGSASGSIFLDYRKTEAKIRNGQHDEDEPGLAGMRVNLFSAPDDNFTGQVIDVDVRTDAYGDFRFGGLVDGVYTVTPMVNGRPLGESGQLAYVEEDSHRFEIDASGQQEFDDLDFPIRGTIGNVSPTLDLVATSYMDGSFGVSQLGQRTGGLVSLDADGGLNFVILKGGFDGIKFADFVADESMDRALLYVVDQQDRVHVAQLTSRDFKVVNGEGYGIQFRGGMSDLVFTISENMMLDDVIDQLANVGR